MGQKRHFLRRGRENGARNQLSGVKSVSTGRLSAPKLPPGRRRGRKRPKIMRIKDFTKKYFALRARYQAATDKSSDGPMLCGTHGLFGMGSPDSGGENWLFVDMHKVYHFGTQIAKTHGLC